MTDHETAFELRQVSKRFPGTLAVDNMDFSVKAGEVHALVGENGAGKSTLMKIIAGSFDDYTGQVFIGGKEIALHSPAVAKDNGIQMIRQELSLALPLSIAENILAGRMPVKNRFVLDKKAMITEAKRCLNRVGLDLDPMTPVEEISQHEAQLVEIAKALGNDPRILVMDEPTSALSREEVERLFRIIHQLKEQGLAIIYISHHLSEVFEVADRVTVMRDGKKVATTKASDVTSPQLVEMMVGRSVSDLYAERSIGPGEEKFRVDGLSRYGFFHDISFSIRSGEILGICGLSGSGRTELARSICGIDPLDKGDVYLNGMRITPRNYGLAIRNGLAYLTEDRKLQGLALRMDIGENILSSIIHRNCRGPVYCRNLGRGLAAQLIDELKVYPSDASRMVSNLSGGNQQKVLLAKWLAASPEVLILDEPTRGVDIGAKAVIHESIARIADQGKAILLISSDLPELTAISDRVLIMRKGHMIGEMPRGRYSEDTLLLAANGHLDTVVQ